MPALGRDHEGRGEVPRARSARRCSASSRSAGTRSILLIASATVRPAGSCVRQPLEDRPHALGQRRGAPRSAAPRRRRPPRRPRPPSPSRGRAAAAAGRAPACRRRRAALAPSIAMPRIRVARRLHLVGDDRDLGADHAVQQRRLAGVRLADQRDEAAAGGAHASVLRAARAAPRRRACCAARFDAARALGGAAVLEPRLDREDRRMVRALAVEVDVGRRRQARAPAPIPAARSWRRGACAAAGGDARAPGAQDQRAAPPRARRRGRPRRSPPPSRRRAARSCAGPPVSISERPRRSAAPRSSSAATSAQVSLRTSAFSRGASSPSSAAGSAASSASAMTRPSTRSPRNSSRWLSARRRHRGMGQRLDEQLGPARSRGRAGPRRRPWPGRASIDRLEEAVGPPGPEGEHRRPGRGEDHPVGAADQVLERHEADAAGRCAGSASPSSCRGCRP